MLRSATESHMAQDHSSLAESFRTQAEQEFDFMPACGFRRAEHLEHTTPTICSMVYTGAHVGFVFSLDLRDRCIDAEIVAVRDGRLADSLHGGYSSDLFQYLVRHAAYRGGTPNSASAAPGTTPDARLRAMIATWADILRQAGSVVLRDDPQVLPT